MNWKSFLIYSHGNKIYCKIGNTAAPVSCCGHDIRQPQSTIRIQAMPAGHLRSCGIRQQRRRYRRLRRSLQILQHITLPPHNIGNNQLTPLRQCKTHQSYTEYFIRPIQESCICSIHSSNLLKH